MNKNLKNSYQTNDRNQKTWSNIHGGKVNTSNAITIPIGMRETGEYLEINQFRIYRDSMIRKIDAAQINNSFLEIRQLISSLKEVTIDPVNTSSYPYNKTNSPSIINSPYSKFHDAQIANNNNEESGSLIKSKRESPGLSVSKTKGGKKTHKDQVSKLLTNLHIYINNNLSEINELKSIIKASSTERNISSSNMPKIELFDGQESKYNSHKEEPSNELQMEDPVLVAQKKVHKVEVEKLLTRIKNFTEKENKMIEKIEELKRIEESTLRNLEKGYIIINTKISGLINDEAWSAEPEKKKFFSNFIYESYVMLATKTSLVLFKSLADQRESMVIELSSILDVSYFIKEIPIDLNSSFFSDEEGNLKDQFNSEANFNGFQLKLNSKNMLFMRINSISDMIKLDSYFFISNVSRNNSGIELFFKFSKNMASVCLHGNAIENLSPSIKKGTASPSMTDLDLSNLSNLQSDKRTSIAAQPFNEKNFVKKKSIFNKTQQQIEQFSKKLKTATIVESTELDLQNPNNNSLSKKQLPEFSQSNIVSKGDSSKFIKKHSLSDKKDSEYRFMKAVKILRNGFIFLKYGKYGDPHERLVYLNEVTNALEWRDINKKKSNGNLEIATITEIKEDETKNDKKTQAANNNENLGFSIIGKNVSLILESGCEKSKREFIANLKIIMEK